MRIRYCPKCGKAGVKIDDPDGRGYDGLTGDERYSKTKQPLRERGYEMRYCPRCREWVNPDLSRNYDQHKVR